MVTFGWVLILVKMKQHTTSIKPEISLNKIIPGSGEVHSASSRGNNGRTTSLTHFTQGNTLIYTT
jgi:hypothetical protein